MNKEILLNKIKDIAIEQKGKSMTRADLAFELKEYGIENDSLLVSRLVWEAYCMFNHLQAIESAFVNNDSNCSVVKDYTMHVLQNKGDTEQYFSALQDILDASREVLNTLPSLIGEGNSVSVQKNVLALLNAASGAKSIQDILKNASNVIEAYSYLISEYDACKEAVKGVTTNYVDTRNGIAYIYDKFVLLLMDFFGDSIKHVAPELFDFNTIEFLDTQSMLQATKLKYDELSENCSVLVNEIGENFINSVKGALQAGRGAGRGTGLAIAGVYAISYFLDANEKENRMKMDFESLKMDVKHDVTAIKSDYARIFTVYKTINDLYLPKAHVYLKSSEKLLSGDFNKFIAVLYEKAGVKELIVKRDAVQLEIKQLTDEINDHQNNIDSYEQNIGRCQSMLDAKKDDYQNAMEKCPNKPFFLVNWLTLGAAKRSYNRNLYNWDAVCGNVVREYNKFQCDIQLDAKELSSHKEKLSVLVAERKKKKLNNDALTKQIRQSILVDVKMKKEIAPYLESIFKILYIGRDILQSKLSPNLMKTINIKDYRNNELPEDVKQSINRLTSVFGQYIPTVASDISQIIVGNHSDEKPQVEFQTNQKANVGVQRCSRQEEVTQKVTQALERGLSCMQSWIELRAKRLRFEVSSAQYSAQIMEIEKSFKSDMQDIDNKSAVLNEILKHINTASDNGQQKQAFLELADATKVFGDMDALNDFLNGNKKIEI